MTVSVSDRLSPLYVGDNSQTRFDFTFKAFPQEDATGVEVRFRNGSEFESLDTEAYAVTFNENNNGGYVSFVDPPSASTFFYIAGGTTVDQLLDITNYDNFYPESIEHAFDKITAILQEWYSRLDQETLSRILADVNYDQLAQFRENELKQYLESLVNTLLGAETVPLKDSYIQTWSGRTQRDKNKDYISSLDVGLIDSSTEDQTVKFNQLLNFAVATGSKIRFQKNINVLLTSNVDLFSGISIDFNNSTLHILNTKETTDISAPLTFNGFAKYENLKIKVDNASKFRRLMYAFDNSLFENTHIYADSEFILDKINSIDSGIMLRGSNIHFENFTSDNIDRLFRVYSIDSAKIDNISFKKIRAKNYTTGIVFTNVSNMTIEDATFDTIASSATSTAGNNAILGGGLCNDVTIEQITINESGEHGIYLNDDAGSGAFSGLKMTNVTVKKSGQCGVKIRRLTDIQVSDIYTQDAAFNNTTGENEDGVRLELCDRGTVSNIHSFTNEKGNSCNVGVLIDSCTNLTVDDVHTNKTKFAGVQISDTYLTALDNLVLKDIYSHNSDQYGLYVNTPNTVLSSFKAIGLTVMNPTADPVYWNTSGGSAGTHYIDLYTDKETSNFVNNVNSDKKLLVQKTYVGRNVLYGDDRVRFGTINTGNFDPSTSGRSALSIGSQNQTDTINSYSSAAGFYRSGRRKAAISLYQVADSAAQQGLAFFATNSTTAATDTVYLSAKLHQTGFYAGADNVSSLGTSVVRWKDIYAATSSISTSDERYKQDIEEISEVEKRVALACKQLIRKYRFKDAVLEKGTDARLHFGVIAQSVKSAFEAEGLDAFDYGVVCHDSWDAVEKVEHKIDSFDENGNEIKQTITVSEAVEAGDRYSIRYEELIMFILSAI